jgi:hypothetical protein
VQLRTGPAALAANTVNVANCCRPKKNAYSLNSTNGDLRF